MKKLALSLAAFAGLVGLFVAIAAYERTFHPRFHETRQYDREPY